MLEFFKNKNSGPFVEFGVGDPNINAKDVDWKEFKHWDKSSLFMKEEDIYLIEPILWAYTVYMYKEDFVVIKKQAFDKIIKIFDIIKGILKEYTYVEALIFLEKNDLVEFRFNYIDKLKKVESMTKDKNATVKALYDFISWAEAAIKIADYIIYCGE